MITDLDAEKLEVYENPAILTVKESISILTNDVSSLEVVDAGSESKGLEIAKTIKSHMTAIEDIRKTAVKPFNDKVKLINDFVKTISNALSSLDYSIRSKMRQYAEELEAERRKQEEKNAKKIEKAIEKGKPVPIIQVVETHERAKTDVGTISYQKVWTFQIINDSQIPREYCTPSESMIRAAVKAGQRMIPGVRIYEETKTILR